MILTGIIADDDNASIKRIVHTNDDMQFAKHMLEWIKLPDEQRCLGMEFLEGDNSPMAKFLTHDDNYWCTCCAIGLADQRLLSVMYAVIDKAEYSTQTEGLFLGTDHQRASLFVGDLILPEK